MKELTPETKEFIRLHRSDNVHVLALSGGKKDMVDMGAAIEQIAGWQIAVRKIPSWSRVEGIRYPRRLSMEQCSSEMTARNKALLISGDSLVDLTGGLGVDCAFLATRFKNVCYVECQPDLCELAEHNFSVLNLTHIRVCCADSVAYLQRMDAVDCIYIDPARRDKYGGKIITISACVPDVSELESLLVEKAGTVLVKFSPMLDVMSALKDLHFIRQFHIVSVQNECKELLAILRKETAECCNGDKDPLIVCEEISNDSTTVRFEFTRSQEDTAIVQWAEQVESYLYEPYSALLKAGAFRILSQTYHVKKLHVNSHLYTSGELFPFPGRRFKVTGVSGFGKKELKTFLQNEHKANLTVRNFPLSVAELRKMLKLQDGGDCYIFSTTLADGMHVLVKCEKL